MMRIARSMAMAAALACGLAATASGAAEPACAVLVGETLRAGEVELRLSRPSEVSPDTPTIVMYHGFGDPADAASLERALPPLAGAITVYPTLPFTGSRLPPGGTAELARLQARDYAGELLYPVIARAAGELPEILAAVAERHGNGEGAIGLFGFSAGGAAALLAATEGRARAEVVVALNAPLAMSQAVANWERLSGRRYRWTSNGRKAARAYDVSARADDLATAQSGAAIVLFQGENDPQFAVATALQAAASLRAAFASHGTGGTAEAIGLPAMGHQLTPATDEPSRAAAIQVRHTLASHLGLTETLPCS